MELNLDQLLQKGIAAHKAGKLQEADHYYTLVLQSHPKHPDANHNMGVLAVGVGKVDEALKFFKTALEETPDNAQFWLSYIDALMRLDRLDDAQVLFDQARSKGAKGDGFDRLEKRLSSLGVIINHSSEVQDPTEEQLQALIDLYSGDQLQKALTSTLKLIEKFPKSVVLHNICGAVNASLKEYDNAIDAYKKAIAIKPDYAEAYYNMGVAHQDQGYFNDAEEAYKNAIVIKPDYVDAHNNMGNALKDQGKLDDAIEAYKKVIAIKPDYAEAYYNMGNTLQDQGKLDDAIDAYNKTLAIKPNYAEAYLNMMELLKVYTPKNKNEPTLIKIDQRVKCIGKELINAATDAEVAGSLLRALDCISSDKADFKTPLSQIYRRNSTDLNCKRHTIVFNTLDIIPEFCFSCLKVQVEVPTFFDLIKLTCLFYKFEFESDLTRKTIIELRPDISGFYKGLIYCRGLDQAYKVKKLLDIDLLNKFDEEIISQIKRGCSEFEIKFPRYGIIDEDKVKSLRYPRKWEINESKFDATYKLKPREKLTPSISGFCASDFHIIQKWIDYGKGLKDPTCEQFANRPIIFNDIFNAALVRKAKFDKVL